MDIKLEKKTGWRAIVQKKNIPYAVAVLFVVFIIVTMLHPKHSTLRVDAQMLSISEVKRCEFNDYVRLTGSAAYNHRATIAPRNGYRRAYRSRGGYYGQAWRCDY